MKNLVSDPPARQIDVPTLVARSQSSRTGIAWTDMWLDHDGTRYHAMLGETDDSLLILVGHGDPMGQWARFQKGGYLSWSYVSEKLLLREGDRPGWTQLLSALLAHTDRQFDGR